MIPAAVGFLQKNFEVEEQPSKTYAMDLENEDTVKGYTDGQEAMRQAIYKILMTERYKYVMYPWSYGIELADLFGEPMTFVIPEVERRIREALTADDRISAVTDFEHDTSTPHVLHTTFQVHTIFGTMQADREVNI